jgi:predicted choloylglycine hydrolase
MKEFRMKGSYYNIGKTFGKTLSNWHRQFKPNDKLLEFARKCEDAVAKFAPDILDELKGIAEVSGAKYESLISTMLSPFYLFGCTLFAVKGEYTLNGNPIFARQMDWLMEDVDALCVNHTEPDSSHKSIGFSFGDCGRYGGQNEEGLTIGSAALAMYTGKVKPGVRMNISTRWILDKFSTTEEAVEYLRRIPHTEAVAFLVADKFGTIARVEAASEKTEARYLEEGIEVVTNVFVLDGMKHLDKGLPENSHTYAYCERLEEWFEANKGKITLERVKAICSDPENGVCQTSKEYEVTIWSWIASTNPTSIEIAPGPPCDTPYKALPWVPNR